MNQDIIKDLMSYIKDKEIDSEWFEWSFLKRLKDDIEIKNKLLSIEEKYGIKTSKRTAYSLYNFRVELAYGCYVRIAKYTSIPNNGNIPEQELVEVEFPYGTLMYWDNHIDSVKKKMYDDLIELNPKYQDLRNGSFYYKLDEWMEVYKKIPEMIKWWRELYMKEYKKAKKERLLKQIEELEK